MLSALTVMLAGTDARILYLAQLWLRYPAQGCNLGQEFLHPWCPSEQHDARVHACRHVQLSAYSTAGRCYPLPASRVSQHGAHHVLLRFLLSLPSIAQMRGDALQMAAAVSGNTLVMGPSERDC